jgi:hypothetical protein
VPRPSGQSFGVIRASKTLREHPSPSTMERSRSGA